MTTRAQSFRRVTVPWTARAPYSRNAVTCVTLTELQLPRSCVLCREVSPLTAPAYELQRSQLKVKRSPHLRKFDDSRIWNDR